MSLLPRIVLCCSVCLFALGLKGQTDSLRERQLQAVEVKGLRTRSFLKDPVQGVTEVDLQLLDDMPHILGNADPMHYAQLLPGVQTNSEYDAGLHIQGCDNQHNFVSVEGVPLFNVQHALGFFSIFNATHFQRLRLSKTAPSAADANRLGGMVDMVQREVQDSAVGGDLSVGPMSSQGTLRLPIGSRHQLTLSARAAYLNLLYGRWLKFEEDEVAYGFDDYNLTWQWWPDARNRVWIDAYYGGDLIKNSNGDFAYDTQMKWKNLMMALHWNHETAKAKLEQTLYYTHYDNRFGLDEDRLHVELTSDITSVGYQGRLTIGRLTAGLHTQWYNILPQSPRANGLFSVESPSVSRQYATESSAFADYRVGLTNRLTLQAGLRASLYHHQRPFWSLDPSASLRYDAGQAGAFMLHADIRHQYLFRSGVSDIGLPTEFWFASGSRHRPQYAYGLSASHEVYLFDKMLRIETSLYYKWLRHQVEYSGNVNDFLYEQYDLDRILLEGKGRNYGLNVLIEKRKGRVTGWLSYAWGRASRCFDQKTQGGGSLDDDGRHGRWYPASHERIHELNAVATYKLNRRWSFGGMAVLASGTPFTAPRQFYLINNNIISEFSEHNAHRLRPYFRLDLSANYEFKSTGARHSGVNFSLYNVTMANNDLFYRLKIYQGKFAYKPYRFVMPILPSVNYYYRF